MADYDLAAKPIQPESFNSSEKTGSIWKNLVPFGRRRLVTGWIILRSAGNEAVYRRLRSRLARTIKSTAHCWRLYLVDLVSGALALVFAAVLRLGPQTLWTDPNMTGALVATVGLFVVICAVTFPAAGLYVRNWRYASILDYIVIVRAVLIASLVMISCMFLYSRLAFVPRSTIAIEVMALISLLASVRLGFRHEDLKAARLPAIASDRGFEALIPILLVGPGHEADLYLRALQRDTASPYWPVGFISSLEAETGTTMRGVPVLGTPKEFQDIVADLEARGQKPRHLIFAVPVSSLDGHAAEHLIELADRMGINVFRLNPATELRNAWNTNEFELRPIELTDLLERPQMVLDVAVLSRFLSGRRVLVTGAGGSIGGELTRQIAALDPAQLVLIDNCEFNLYSIDLDLAEKHPIVPRFAYLCDVRDATRLNEIFRERRPELVFHAAALKHVPMVELNPCEGVFTNVIGTMNVAKAVISCGALGMVQVSTDKVVNSTSVMGATKRLAELYCQALDLEGLGRPDRPRFMTVRFGNVLGSSGSLIPLFKRQLARGGPLTVTHPDMKRFFMTVREAVELTLQASAYGLEKQLAQGEIFVLDMGEPIKIIDIARRMIRLAGLEPDRDVTIEIVGCRPGEKLFEELFDPTEKRVRPPIPGVLGAVPAPVPLETLHRAFQDLQACVSAGDTARLVATIQTLLPSFRRDPDAALPSHLATGWAGDDCIGAQETA